MGRIRDRIDEVEMRKAEARAVISEALVKALEVMKAYRLDIKFAPDEKLLDISYYIKEETPSLVDTSTPEAPAGEQDAD